MVVVAQLVEHRVVVPVAAGSSPVDHPMVKGSVRVTEPFSRPDTILGMDFLEPFVLPVESREPERVGNVDIYPPDIHGRAPAVLIVHGGPMPEQVRPIPQDWP